MSLIIKIEENILFYISDNDKYIIIKCTLVRNIILFHLYIFINMCKMTK